MVLGRLWGLLLLRLFLAHLALEASRGTKPDPRAVAFIKDLYSNNAAAVSEIIEQVGAELDHFVQGDEASKIADADGDGVEEAFAFADEIAHPLIEDSYVTLQIENQ